MLSKKAKNVIVFVMVIVALFINLCLMITVPNVEAHGEGAWCYQYLGCPGGSRICASVDLELPDGNHLIFNCYEEPWAY
jgi:hypothetical protein